MATNKLSRNDLDIIIDWIKPNSRVLDLGCGDGSLLKLLQEEKQTTGYGIELNPESIPKCIENGVNVIQTNLDKGLTHFDSNSFDYVILSLTLQAVHKPDKLINEMLRIGKQGIVTFPNFGHWNARFQIGVLGKMPVSKCLPNRWYNTPNIHLCTLQDFEALCKQQDIKILQSRAVNHAHKTSLGLKLFPNLLGEIALYRFSK